MYCLVHKVPFDIQLNTTGDIPILVSSINKWVKFLNEKCAEPHQYDWKLLYPSVSATANVHHKYEGFMAHRPRMNTCIIYVNETGLPTSGEKRTPVNYSKCAESLIPSVWSQNSQIVWLPIFDDVFWPRPDFGDDQLNTSRVKARNKTYNVFAYGNTAMYRGVVTTYADFTLYGFGYPQVNGKWDVTKPEDIVPVKVDRIESFTAWNLRVCQDMSIQIVSCFRPLSRYSPISNLPYLSKAGVQITLSQATDEDGVLIANHSFVLSKSDKIVGRVIRPMTSIGSATTSTTTTTATVTTTMTTQSQTGVPLTTMDDQYEIDEEPAPPFDLFGSGTDELESVPQEDM
jgi:hypothetical protein